MLQNVTTFLYQKHFFSVRKSDLRTFECKNPKVALSPCLGLDFYLHTLSGFFRILCSHPWLPYFMCFLFHESMRVHYRPQTVPHILSILLAHLVSYVIFCHCNGLTWMGFHKKPNSHPYGISVQRRSHNALSDSFCVPHVEVILFIAAWLAQVAQLIWIGLAGELWQYVQWKEM